MHKQSFVSFFARIVRIAMHTTRAGDWVIVSMALAGVATLVVFAWHWSAGKEAPYVEITTANGTFLYQLDQARTLSIDGPLGITRVVIEKKSVNVIESPGRRQICVNAKPITRQRQWLACLPNRVFLRIYGNTSRHEENAIDALSF